MKPDQVREERIKLFATYLNTMAAGTFVAGALAPSVNMAIGSVALRPLALFAFGAIVLSVAIHLIAQAVYGMLQR